MTDKLEELTTLTKHGIHLLEQSNSIHTLEKNLLAMGNQINDLVSHLNKVNNEAAAKIMKLEQRTADLERILAEKEERKLKLMSSKDKEESYDT